MMEQAGRYWGAPADSQAAIHEIERQRASGAGFVIFAWPAFWWLERYSEMTKFLREQFSCVMENERLIAFDLRKERKSGG
jgi:hypothetical protein